jgi:hypothetical protein
MGPIDPLPEQVQREFVMLLAPHDPGVGPGGFLVENGQPV